LPLTLSTPLPITAASWTRRLPNSPYHRPLCTARFHLITLTTLNAFPDVSACGCLRRPPRQERQKGQEEKETKHQRGHKLGKSVLLLCVQRRIGVDTSMPTMLFFAYQQHTAKCSHRRVFTYSACEKRWLRLLKKRYERLIFLFTPAAVSAGPPASSSPAIAFSHPPFSIQDAHPCLNLAQP